MSQVGWGLSQASSGLWSDFPDRTQMDAGHPCGSRKHGSPVRCGDRVPWTSRPVPSRSLPKPSRRPPSGPSTHNRCCSSARPRSGTGTGAGGWRTGMPEAVVRRRSWSSRAARRRPPESPRRYSSTLSVLYREARFFAAPAHRSSYRREAAWKYVSSIGLVAARRTPSPMHIRER